MAQIKKSRKWKNIKIPEELWHTIKVEAAKGSTTLFQEIAKHYPPKTNQV